MRADIWTEVREAWLKPSGPAKPWVQPVAWFLFYLHGTGWEHAAAHLSRFSGHVRAHTINVFSPLLPSSTNNPTHRHVLAGQMGAFPNNWKEGTWMCPRSTAGGLWGCPLSFPGLPHQCQGSLHMGYPCQPWRHCANSYQGQRSRGSKTRTTDL